MTENLQSQTSVLAFEKIIAKDLVTSPNVDQLVAKNQQLTCQSLNQDFKAISESLYRPLVVVGPSGAGKGTLISAITSKYQKNFGFSVSYTTRKARQGEVDGQHYFFVSRDVFEHMIQQDQFIEYCEVHSNYYGTAKSQIQTIREQKKIPLLDIDVQGCYKFSKVFPESVVVAIVPPSVDELKNRLLARGTETEKTLETRLKNAPQELSDIFGKPAQFPLRIVNQDLNLSRNTFEVLLESVYQNEFGLRIPQSLQRIHHPFAKL